MYCDFCRWTGPTLAGKTDFVDGSTNLNMKTSLLIVKVFDTTSAATLSLIKQAND